MHAYVWRECGTALVGQACTSASAHQQQARVGGKRARATTLVGGKRARATTLVPASWQVLPGQ
eukprot:8964-Chlamydomonas_euryale.AAC.1